MYGGTGVRAAPLRLRLRLMDLSGAQDMHKTLAGPRPTLCTFKVPSSPQTGSCLSWGVSRRHSSPFHPRFHKHIWLLLSNSPVSRRGPSPASLAVRLHLPIYPGIPSRV